jgi:phosphoglucomutase|tara:strand:+ start:3348 stop:5081 length:1734 start_codon:yes stop_codon:yes gene_type:complete
MSEKIDISAYNRALDWIESSIDDSDKLIIKDWLVSDPKTLNESFYKDLEFGTGGIRGLMRLGSNGVNKYTLGLATQGLSNYLNLKISEKPKVAIAYDSRNNSETFADEVSKVLRANNIDVFLFSDLRPTPQLSYAVRSLSCNAGIVITASHNPKEYNGFKVYWSDGGQLVAPQDQEILTCVKNLKVSDIKWNGGNGEINYLGKEIDDSYLKNIEKLSLNPVSHSNIKLVFTSLHGTAITLLPQVLQSFGFKNIHILESQKKPDGDFPTVISPNPEEAEALDLALQKAREIDADMVIGCDPDSDRVGIAVRDHQNELILLNGNQTAAVLFDYILKQKRISNSLPKNGFVASTVVTSALLGDIAKSYSIPVYNTLTGFKWIAELINKLEGEKEFIIGGEESYGYLIGSFVRDKDAISASALLAETASWYLDQGLSFYSQLMNIYAVHGTHEDSLFSVIKKGQKGAQEIQEIMSRLRENPPKEIGTHLVNEISDFKTSKCTNISLGTDKIIDLPISNVLQFRLNNGDRITVRPSGTEPKIKYYFNTKGAPLNLTEENSYEIIRAELRHRIELYKSIVADF